MRVLLCLSPLAALTWVAAAPVPKVVPDFTRSCTAEGLAKLPFGKTGPAKDRDTSEAQAAKSVAIAVHLPRATFENGDPIPALFVVKNRSDQPHGLWMEFDFTRRYAAGGGGIEVRNTKTDAVTSPFLGTATMCGGPRSAIPANGYWTRRGNVGVTGSGEPLPVGDYELTWDYAGVRSNSVKFTVVSRRLGRPEPEPRRVLHLLRLEPGETDTPLAWTRAEVTATPTAGLTHALGTGVFGGYHPDVGELPAAADGLRAAATWDGDTVKVTLDSPGREYDFLACRKPVVFLLVECVAASPEDAMDRAQEKAADRKSTADERLKLPVTVGIRLPKGWQDTAGASGECRVSVLVASREPPERSYGLLERRLRVVQAVEDEKLRKEVLKTKTGEWVLKTEWQALQKPGVRQGR